MIGFVAGQPSAALKRLQDAERRLAEILVGYCDERGLTSFLVAGSALGAWREGDFIAWDDDIDFGMLRADYDHLLAAWQRDPPSGITLQCYLTEPGYPFAYAKLRLDGTAVVEDRCLPPPHHQGIFIDIFPFDTLPRSAFLRGLQQFGLRAVNLFVMSYSAQASHGAQALWLRMLRRLAFTIRPAVPVRLLIRLREWLARMSFAAPSQQLASFEMYGIRFARRTIVDRAVLVPPGKARFGPVEMPVPANCDAYLTGVFGDWRTLPPEERRQPLHVRAVDFGDYSGKPTQAAR